MELGTIEREIHIAASVDVVFDVISKPEHVRQWWPDDAHYDLAPGASGEIVFGEPGAGGTAVALTVVDVDPPHRFTFRWTHPVGEPAVDGNSLLVRFELIATDDGTLLRMTESGFREQGWEVAVLEQQYSEHVTGWDFFLPRLSKHAADTMARS